MTQTNIVLSLRTSNWSNTVLLCRAGLGEESFGTHQQGQHGQTDLGWRLQWGSCFADTTGQAWLPVKPSTPSAANFKMLNLYIRTRTKGKPLSKQDLKEESGL